MSSITLFENEKGKLVFIDTGHLHKDPNAKNGKFFRPEEIHVHEVDLSKITFEQLEKLVSESRRGEISLHDWKRVPGACITRYPYPDEASMIERMLNK